MKPDPTHVSPTNVEPAEAQDAVWAMLRRARPVPAPPHFASRVLAAARQAQADRASRWHWVKALFPSAPRLAWAAAALAVTAGGGWWLAQETFQAPSIAPVPVSVAVALEPAPATGMEDPLGEQILAELAMLDEATALLAPRSAQELREVDLENILF